MRPGIVFGQGAGEIAAAQAAGMLSLEDGLRLAAARGRLTGAMAQADSPASLEDALAGITMSPAALTFVSGTTGHASRPGDALTGDDWKQQVVEPADPGTGATTLADLEVDAIVEIGPDATLGPAMLSGWPQTAERAAPVVITGLHPSAVDDAGIAAAVAKAWEAGLPVRFEGLFAGEARRRISVPGYPFQRRSFWMRSPKR